MAPVESRSHHGASHEAGRHGEGEVSELELVMEGDLWQILLDGQRKAHERGPREGVRRPPPRTSQCGRHVLGLI